MFLLRAVGTAASTVRLVAHARLAAPSIIRTPVPKYTVLARFASSGSVPTLPSSSGTTPAAGDNGISALADALNATPEVCTMEVAINSIITFVLYFNVTGVIF